MPRSMHKCLLAGLTLSTITLFGSNLISADDRRDFLLEDGALIVTAIARSHKESDFQSYKRIPKMRPDRKIQYSSDVTTGYWNLTITENAVRDASRYWPYFLDNMDYKSSTALAVSESVWEDLKSRGAAEFSLYMAEKEELFCEGELTRLGEENIELIFDDTVQLVPVVEARLEGSALVKGSDVSLGSCEADLTILDHGDNPVILRLDAKAAGHREPSRLSVTVVRLDSGRSIKERIENALSDGERAALYGIHFDFGKATIRSDSAPVLRAIAELLEEKSELGLRLEGHTDWIGDEAWNQTLSEQRALAVKTYLVEQFGINSGRLQASGFGEFKPVPGSDQNTLVGRAINRRVEAVIVQPQ